MSKLTTLQAEFGRLQDEATAIHAAAKTEDRQLTEEEFAAATDLLDKSDAVKADIEAIQARDAQAARLSALDAWGDTVQPQVTPPAKLTPAAGGTPDAAGSQQPRFDGPYAFGKFLQAVAISDRRRGAPLDDRLSPMAATGLSEGIPSEGGFLVATDWANELIVEAYTNSIALNGGPGFPGVRRIPLSGNANGIKINTIDETNRAAGSRWGGVQAYWLDEAGTKTPTKPTFRQVELNVKKLIGLCYATDELLQDAAALEAVIRQAFAEEFAFQIQDAVIGGTGAGMPLGIKNASCLVSVAKENNQAADTIVTENIEKMYSRMKPTSVGNAVWLINQNCYPALFGMTLTVGTGGVPTWLPPGGLSQSPYGTLMGRPVVPIEQCESVGTVGDILFADLSQYLFCDKGTPESASSIHVQFTTDQTVFRFVYRCDGQPAQAAALTPFKGTSDTVSPFVALASRD
ncbi:MAG: phage major capsid protein [Planctomycetes bacterium]|nr:phage major capsid protein [Planctomycetota bacterium]